MARPRGDGWVADGYDENGKRRRLKYAVEEEAIEEAPTISLKQDPDARRFRVFSYAEEDKLLAKFRYEVDRRFVEFLLDTGCRYGETERLTWLDFSHNERTITIWK